MENKYEILFDGFMNAIDFELVKHPDGFGVIDWQGANLGNIENDRYKTAQDVFERVDMYIHDYFIVDIDEVLADKGVKVDWGEDYESYLTNSKESIECAPELTWEFEVLDMICYHFEEIDLNNCHYTTDETCAKEDR